MKFQFPQFIDTKGKVVGPFTIAQFMYVAIAGIIVFVLQFALSPMLLIIVGVILLLIALAFGFLEVDNVSLPKYLLNAFSFIISPKRYIFSRRENENELYGIPEIPKKVKKENKK